jgi:hypothetical protein
MTVEAAIRRSIYPGQELLTPARKKPFWVGEVDGAGLVLLMGQGHWRVRLSWACLEGVVPFVRERGGTIPIGGRHDVIGNPGTLDEWLKGCVKTTTAGWIAAVLEEAGVVEVTNDIPQRIRLTTTWQGQR